MPNWFLAIWFQFWLDLLGYLLRSWITEGPRLLNNLNTVFEGGQRLPNLFMALSQKGSQTSGSNFLLLRLLFFLIQNCFSIKVNLRSNR